MARQMCTGPTQTGTGLSRHNHPKSDGHRLPLHTEARTIDTEDDVQV